jgi:hypothetical protein
MTEHFDSTAVQLLRSPKAIHQVELIKQIVDDLKDSDELCQSCACRHHIENLDTDHPLTIAINHSTLDLTIQELELETGSPAEGHSRIQMYLAGGIAASDSP